MLATAAVESRFLVDHRAKSKPRQIILDMSDPFSEVLLGNNELYRGKNESHESFRGYSIVLLVSDLLLG